MTHLRWLTCCLLLNFITLNSTLSFSKKKIAVVREFKRCPDPEKSFITMVSNKLEVVGPGQRAISAVFMLPRNVERFTKASLKIYRCPSFSERAECESYLRMQMTENVCARLLKEKEVWTPIIQALNPRFTCPLKMGRYEIKNLTYTLDDFSSLFQFGMENYYWLFDARVYVGKEQAICIVAGGEIKSLKNA